MKNLSASLLFVLLALAGHLPSAQTIHRVNNNGIAGANVYAHLATAQAASNGDIIQVEPSTTAYAGSNVTKQLTFVGPGYFLAENQPPVLQASPIPRRILPGCRPRFWGGHRIFAAGHAGRRPR